VLVALVISVPIGWLFDKIIYGLKLVPVDRQVEGAVKGVVFAAVSGLAFGVIRTNRSVLRKPTDAIRPAETLRWSWRSSLSAGSRGARIGLVTGLILGIFFGLIRGLGIVPIAGLLLSALVYGLVDSLLGGLLGGLIGGFFGGLVPSVREMKTVPNQGIHLSMESAIRAGLPAGLLMGLIVGVIAGSPCIGLTYFMLTALVIGMWFGGLEVIEHGILRVIVAVRDHAAFNYARFLDYAADELKFLQKVGGGYLFIHRYLLEYFAELEAAEDPISAGLDSGAAHDDGGMPQSPPIELVS
jgi:hypothetical protein